MALDPPIWLQNRQYSARLDRNLVDIFFTEGTVEETAYLVVERDIGANNSVDIHPGRAIITGDDEADQGKYLVRNADFINVALSAAPVSDARIDLVVLQVNDSVAGSSRTPADEAELAVVEGTASGSPATPALPDTAIPLAAILRTTGDSFVDNSMITDLRTPATTADFTVRSNFERLTTTERDALTAYPGQVIYNLTEDRVEYWDAAVTAWTPIATPVYRYEFVISTSTNRVFELTDESKLIRYNGTGAASWVIPNNTDAAFPLGCRIDIARWNTGSLAIVGDTGVTIRSSRSAIADLRYSVLTIVKVDTNEWLLAGDQQPV